jgi:hypothetical protein
MKNNFIALNLLKTDLSKMGMMGEKAVEQKDPNFAVIGSLINDHRYTPENYHKPFSVGHMDCNCIIHDFAFQNRSSKPGR